jgi:hypothetical protein
LTRFERRSNQRTADPSGRTRGDAFDAPPDAPPEETGVAGARERRARHT